MTLYEFLIAALIVSGATVVLLIAYPILRKKKKMLSNIVGILATVCGISAIGMLIFYLCITADAKTHGAYGDYTRKETIAETLDNIKNGVIDQSDELPEDLSGKVLIIFKYGCPDCEATYGNIYDDLVASGCEYYFVSSRSEIGMQLVTKYYVTEVPSGVYVSTGSGHNIGFMTESLYTYVDGIPVYWKNHMETLLNEEAYERSLQQ